MPSTSCGYASRKRHAPCEAGRRGGRTHLDTQRQHRRAHLQRLLRLARLGRGAREAGDLVAAARRLMNCRQAAGLALLGWYLMVPLPPDSTPSRSIPACIGSNISRYARCPRRTADSAASTSGRRCSTTEPLVIFPRFTVYSTCCVIPSRTWILQVAAARPETGFRIDPSNAA